MLLDILISSSKSHSVQSAENLKIFLANGYSQFWPIYLFKIATPSISN